MPEINFTDHQAQQTQAEINRRVARDQAALKQEKHVPEARKLGCYAPPAAGKQQPSFPKRPRGKPKYQNYGSDDECPACRKRKPYCRCSP